MNQTTLDRGQRGCVCQQALEDKITSIPRPVQTYLGAVDALEWHQELHHLLHVLHLLCSAWPPPFPTHSLRTSNVHQSHSISSTKQKTWQTTIPPANKFLSFTTIPVGNLQHFPGPAYLLFICWFPISLPRIRIKSTFSPSLVTTLRGSWSLTLITSSLDRSACLGARDTTSVNGSSLSSRNWWIWRLWSRTVMRSLDGSWKTAEYGTEGPRQFKM